MPLKQPETAEQILGDKISRAGILASPETRLAAMGEVAMNYADDKTSGLVAVIRTLITEAMPENWHEETGQIEAWTAAMLALGIDPETMKVDGVPHQKPGRIEDDHNCNHMWRYSQGSTVCNHCGMRWEEDYGV